MTITDLAAFSGLFFGAVGATFGVCNYLRDAAKITVYLKWDMQVAGEENSGGVGCIKVANHGRRATFISHVALRLPKGENLAHILIKNSLHGQKLSEGDSPIVFSFEQTDLEQYAGRWDQIVAQVSDSTGKEWFSKKVTIVPSWAKTEATIR